MSFIISKTSTSHGESRKLYYLVQNYREDNKIKRRTLLKLNENVDLSAFFEKTLQEERNILDNLSKAKESFKKLLENEDQPQSGYLKKLLPIRIVGFENSLRRCRVTKDILQVHLKE
jgi:hypothetical protein